MTSLLDTSGNRRISLSGRLAAALLSMLAFLAVPEVSEAQVCRPPPGADFCLDFSPQYGGQAVLDPTFDDFANGRILQDSFLSPFVIAITAKGSQEWKLVLEVLDVSWGKGKSVTDLKYSFNFPDNFRNYSGPALLHLGCAGCGIGNFRLFLGSDLTFASDGPSTYTLNNIVLTVAAKCDPTVPPQPVGCEDR